MSTPRRRIWSVVVALLGVLGASERAAAQTSVFSIRGLGLPAFQFSTRVRGNGGGFALFDPETAINPASIAGLVTSTATLNMVQEFRSTTSEGGSADIQTARFPLVMVGGPIQGTPIVVAASVGSYTSRDYAFTSSDSILLRGVKVGVYDTVSSLGGINDLRAAVAYVKPGQGAIGIAVHAILGSTRNEAIRTFSDSAYFRSAQKSQISYNGLGVSAGFTAKVVGTLFASGSLRADGNVRIVRDSLQEIGRTPLPLTWTAGLRWRPFTRLDLAGFYQGRNWSVSDSAIVAQGGIGAFDTKTVAIGGEFYKDARNPLSLPLRFGYRWSSLPFPAVRAYQPSEETLSAGTGFRFANGRGGFDFSIERVTRRDGNGRSDSGVQIGVGISVRP